MDDTWIIISIGLVIIAVNVGLFAWLHSDLVELARRIDTLSERLDSRIHSPSERVDSPSERMARMEGKMDLLLQGLQIRIEPRPPA